MSAWEKYFISQMKSVYLALSPLVRLCLQSAQKWLCYILKNEAKVKSLSALGRLCT